MIRSRADASRAPTAPLRGRYAPPDPPARSQNPGSYQGQGGRLSAPQATASTIEKPPNRTLAVNADAGRADILHERPERTQVALRDGLPPASVLSWQSSPLPRDQVDHTIRALSRGVTSGDRPVRGRTAGSGIRSGVPRILPGCPSGSAASSLTLTTCPAWPGSGTQAPGGKVLSERRRTRSSPYGDAAAARSTHRPQDGQ